MVPYQQHRGHGPPSPVWDVLISTQPDGRDIRTRVLVNENLYGLESLRPRSIGCRGFFHPLAFGFCWFTLSLFSSFFTHRSLYVLRMHSSTHLSELLLAVTSNIWCSIRPSTAVHTATPPYRLEIHRLHSFILCIDLPQSVKTSNID